MIAMLGIQTARQLIDFSGGQREQTIAWNTQLEGAVALHNILVREKIAYLADEVGMGKTYVALGAVSLFRHFNPGWRVLYIAPRENIQQKWRKELLNFTANHWQITDNRVRSFQGTPAYDLVTCDSLLDLARNAVLNSHRDFLMRLTSFSFGLSKDVGQWSAKRRELLQYIPWLDESLFDLRGGEDKDRFKQNYARAINTVLPHFDLVVIDEGHNLKHGFSEHVAARNRLLAYVLGRDTDSTARRFPNYGRKFERVLILSATPLESDYRELWNQLDLFGQGERWAVLNEAEADDRAKEEAARQFLVRRLTGLQIGGQTHTKNMYRREWRNGGVNVHDEALKMANERQRLIVALVQKKVAEVLGSDRFNNNFQIGMLASFESFMETAGVKAADSDDESAFDDAEQAEQQVEKDGIDTPSLNTLAKSYQREFGASLPHPKMDVIADSLKDSFETGDKALIFVRRVKSVDELQEKLEQHYDAWLLQYLLSRLPASMHQDLQKAFDAYTYERRAQVVRIRASETPDMLENAAATNGRPVTEDDDEGDNNTFFAWFFRGKERAGIFSGAAFNKNRLMSESSAYATFFDDNYVLFLLGDSDDLLIAISERCSLPISDVRRQLRERANLIFRSASRQKRFPRARVYWAYQQSAVQFLAENAADQSLRDRAGVILRERFSSAPISSQRIDEDFPEPDDFLAQRTFFTGLRQHPDLYADLWAVKAMPDFADEFRQREQRRELLLAVARLGRPFIDLWLLAAKHLGTLTVKERAEGQAEELIDDYLNLLEQQRQQQAPGYTAYRELFEVSASFELIVAVNFSGLRELPLTQLPRLFGTWLARQTPVGGMSGGVNQRLVRQFRMPGYPLILVTTDVLQEGEDLHTFCSRVIHYGIAWTPSSMEQRTGRIDRIHSLTQRRLDNRPEAHPDELLQVYYPHLQDTVERLQVERVYERMNRFIRLMHHALGAEQTGSRRVDVAHDLVLPPRDIAPIKDPLETKFDIKPEWLQEEQPAQAIRIGQSAQFALQHFLKMIEALRLAFKVDTEIARDWSYLASVFVLPEGRLAKSDELVDAARHQPLTLFLRTVNGGDHIVLHCSSPIGVVPQNDPERIESVGQAQQRVSFNKICAAEDARTRTYNLTVEDDVLFHPYTTQIAEVLDLVSRVAVYADRLERALLDTDQQLAEFREDLIEESQYA